jgi:hypothetical protein
MCRDGERRLYVTLRLINPSQVSHSLSPSQLNQWHLRGPSKRSLSGGTTSQKGNHQLGKAVNDGWNIHEECERIVGLEFAITAFMARPHEIT